MRIAYLSPDRADLLECARHMASQMKEPREGDWCRVQQVGQYLLKHPCLVAVYKPQPAPTCVITPESRHDGVPPPEHSPCSAVTA
eukprot:2185710-Amphidinium_carterae.4